MSKILFWNLDRISGGMGRILEVADRISEALDSFPRVLESGDKPLSKPMIA